MEKVKEYRIFGDGENSTIYKASDPQRHDDVMTFQEAKKQLRGFMHRMELKYSEGKRRIVHLNEDDCKN